MVDFVVGTVTVFNQSSAPTGWTKLTTFDDCALRLVTGTASFSGSVNFSQCMTTRTWSGTVSAPGAGVVGATTLTSPQIPSHTHQVRRESRNPAVTADNPASGFDQNIGLGPTQGGTNTLTSPAATQESATSGATGGGGAHSHPVSLNLAFNGSTSDFSVNYVDLILASKN